MTYYSLHNGKVFPQNVFSNESLEYWDVHKSFHIFGINLGVVIRHYLLLSLLRLQLQQQRLLLQPFCSDDT
jgi:hypothetical protein